MFCNMRKAAQNRLKDRDPNEIACNAGVHFDGKQLRFFCLGKEVAVSYPEYSICPEFSGWKELTVLHYLDLADQVSLSGMQISFSQYKDGMVRGQGFDRKVETLIAQTLGNLSMEELIRRCLACGGHVEPSNADLCVKFQYLPRYPVWLKIWFSDEEFPASGRMLLDKNSEHYLSIEDAVTVGTLLLDALLNM